MEQSQSIQPKPVVTPGNVLLLIFISLGFVVRAWLLLNSTGHGDVALWEQFGSQAAKVGLTEAYRVEPWLNHPPLALLYGELTYRLSATLNAPFPVVFKAPIAFADALACYLLYRIYSSRCGSARAGLIAATILAWNIDAILLSAFHGNTDPFYATLCIAGVWLADSKRMPLLAGLALGAAINVKLLPGMFLLPVLLLSRCWKELLRLMLGLAIMSLPYLWMRYEVGHLFQRRVFSYQPLGGSVISDILISLQSHPLLHNYMTDVIDRYLSISKPLVLICTAIPALAMRRRGEWNRYRALAMAAVVFLLISPAFAVHYTAMVGAALLAYDLWAGALWGFLSGLQLISFYLFLWDGRLPLSAQHTQGAGPTKYFEMLLWAWALGWLIREVHKSAELRRAN